jgi:hypothetical protein
MNKEWMSKEMLPSHSTEREEQTGSEPQDAAARSSGLTGLHRSVGNQAVQRMLAQRSGDGGTALDEETAGRIDRARGGGQALDGALQAQMGESMGYDLSGVRVHTSPEADALNRQLSARAFTTGQDVFFRSGEYDPHSSSGQELIAHELTHVVQQGTGAVRGGKGMTVNEPGDTYEQQADATAKQLIGAGASVQRQEVPEEEEMLQMQPLEEEEEELQAKAIQRQEMPEEEEEEEEEVQAKAVQRQEMPEEEEELQAKAIQRQEVPEEEELAQI